MPLTDHCARQIHISWERNEIGFTDLIYYDTRRIFVNIAMSRIYFMLSSFNLKSGQTH